MGNSSLYSTSPGLTQARIVYADANISRTGPHCTLHAHAFGFPVFFCAFDRQGSAMTHPNHKPQSCIIRLTLTRTHARYPALYGIYGSNHSNFASSRPPLTA